VFVCLGLGLLLVEMSIPAYQSLRSPIPGPDGEPK